MEPNWLYKIPAVTRPTWGYIHTGDEKFAFSIG